MPQTRHRFTYSAWPASCLIPSIFPYLPRYKTRLPAGRSWRTVRVSLLIRSPSSPARLAGLRFLPFYLPLRDIFLRAIGLVQAQFLNYTVARPNVWMHNRRTRPVFSWVTNIRWNRDQGGKPSDARVLSHAKTPSPSKTHPAWTILMRTMPHPCLPHSRMVGQAPYQPLRIQEDMAGL